MVSCCTMSFLDAFKVCTGVIFGLTRNIETSRSIHPCRPYSQQLPTPVDVQKNNMNLSLSFILTRGSPCVLTACRTDSGLFPAPAFQTRGFGAKAIFPAIIHWFVLFKG